MSLGLHRVQGGHRGQECVHAGATAGRHQRGFAGHGSGRGRVDDSAWETEYAKRLHAFVPSPRAAKRFSNVYRILKATVPANALARFEGSANFPGEFRIAMILLAQQISSPHRAAQWFEFLAQQPSDGRLHDALLHPPEGRHHVANGITEGLEDLIIDDARDLPIERVQHWLTIVGRFSFDLTRRRT